MAGVHLFTSFTYAYLQRARVLAESVRKAHRDWTLWAVVVDHPPDGFDDRGWRNAFDHVLDAASLYGETWRNWIFRHDVVEACTAVKGDALLHLLDAGADKVIYLDPDIAVFHDLGDIVRILDSASIVLTPHQVEPNITTEAILDNEITSMKYGIYNLGFLAVRNNADGRAMATWWASCLRHACYDDTANGIFTDQKYCDHLPGLFDNVMVTRDPGYNVASWNLSRRAIRIERDGAITVNGDYPLRFYHFSKINSEGDIMTERYARGCLDVFEIWNWYKRAIAEMELTGIPPQYWAYGQFDDGTRVPNAARILFRTRDDLKAAFSDPFATGRGSYLEWLKSEAPEVLA
jgi:hypothetical protein